MMVCVALVLGRAMVTWLCCRTLVLADAAKKLKHARLCVSCKSGVRSCRSSLGKGKSESQTRMVPWMRDVVGEVMEALRASVEWRRN